MHFYVTSKKHYYQKSWIKLKNPQLNYFLKHLSIQDNAIMWTLVCERPYNSIRIELGWMILQQSRKKYNYLIRGDCLGLVSYSSFRAKIIFSIHVPSLLLVKAWQHYVNIHLHYSQNKKTCIYLRRIISLYGSMTVLTKLNHAVICIANKMLFNSHRFIMWSFVCYAHFKFLDNVINSTVIIYILSQISP